MWDTREVECNTQEVSKHKEKQGNIFLEAQERRHRCVKEILVLPGWTFEQEFSEMSSEEFTEAWEGYEGYEDAKKYGGEESIRNIAKEYGKIYTNLALLQHDVTYKEVNVSDYYIHIVYEE